jgi:aldose sugar dehydrogenase
MQYLLSKAFFIIIIYLLSMVSSYLDLNTIFVLTQENDPDAINESNFTSRSTSTLSFEDGNITSDSVGIRKQYNNSSVPGSLYYDIGELSVLDYKLLTASNPEFVYFNNRSGITVLGQSSFWNGSLECQKDFECVPSSTTGWKDNSSLQISTTINQPYSWSWIYGSEISDIKPGEKYTLITHMKLNENAMRSHIVLQGYNETSEKWFHIIHCPTGTDGPLALEWKMYRCDVIIPEDTGKVRFVLNAGWSSSLQYEAVTWYDAIYMASYFDDPSDDSFVSPILYDKDLTLEVVNDELLQPSTMTFLGKDDFLVLQKDLGTVERIVNGTKLEKPLLDLNVSSYYGALGISAIKPEMEEQMNITRDVDAYVFIYYDESSKAGTDCSCPANASRFYRYELVSEGTKLVNPKLILSVPPGNTFPVMHEGGIVKIGPDGNVYLVVGDARSVPETGVGNVTKNKAVNYGNGSEPDGRAGILRFNVQGEPTKQGILGDNYPLNLYFAYGIRNSFGFAFDPLTGKIWDTENGAESHDEINLVEPGFNSGWAHVMGFRNVSTDFVFLNVSIPDKLVDFNGKGKYSPPEFVWAETVAPTALTFLDSEQFGKYRNDLIVADFYGRIYHFRLNEDRTELLLNGSLSDKIANSQEEADQVMFGEGFGIITDMEIGPDGYLYLVSMPLGKIFKVGFRL